MATKSKYVPASFKTVVQVPLLDAYVEDVESLIVNPKEFDKLLEKLVNDGYTYGVSRDLDTKQYTCKIFGANPELPNAGMQIYGNAPTLKAAVGVALVKHFLVCGELSWADQQSNVRSKYS